MLKRGLTCYKTSKRTDNGACANARRLSKAGNPSSSEECPLNERTNERVMGVGVSPAHGAQENVLNDGITKRSAELITEVIRRRKERSPMDK